MNFNEGVASRYGIKEAVIAQYLWDIVEDGYDDIFKTEEERADDKLARIRDIPIADIDDFPDHPFQVRDDEDMQNLVESIKERGVITPAMVRKKDDGRYELISGHRRKRACELAGMDTLRCEVVDMDRDEATIMMVEFNFQRSNILPSEKAFVYKMRNDALKRQGQRTDLSTSSPVGIKSFRQSLDRLAEESGDSRNQIYRYIRLTELVPELRDTDNDDNTAELLALMKKLKESPELLQLLKGFVK